MSYLNDYRNRINFQGSNVAERMVNQTSNLILQQFENSPSYKLIQIDGNDVGVRLLNGKESSKKSILFKPGESYSVGNVISYDNVNWLLLDFTPNEMFPKGELQKCNFTLSVNTPPTKTLEGYESNGRPIYDETYGAPLLFPCIVENLFYHSKEKDSPIFLPPGNIRVTLSYVDNEELKIGKTINVFDERYSIVGIDYRNVFNNVGTMVFIGEKV